MGHTKHTCASTVSLDAFLHTFVLLVVVYLSLCSFDGCNVGALYCRVGLVHSFQKTPIYLCMNTVADWIMAFALLASHLSVTCTICFLCNICCCCCCVLCDYNWMPSDCVSLVHSFIHSGYVLVCVLLSFVVFCCWFCRAG